MERRLLALLLLSLFEIGSLPARAQEPEIIHLPQQPVQAPAPPRAPATRRTPVNVPEVLGELWFRRKSLLDKGDTAAAERQVALMRDIVRREGIFSADDLSGAFLADGNRALERGSVSRALQSFHLAKEFAPDRPGASFAVARALWSGERDFGGSLSYVFEGLRIVFKNPATRVGTLGNSLAILLAGSLLAAVLWCITAALRTARLAQHDLYEGRKRSLSNNAAQVIAWAIWLLPALLWLIGPWALVYWLAFAFVYMKRSERIVSVLACVVFLLSVPLLGWITRESKVTTDPAVRLLLESARGGIDPERVAALEQMAGSHPGEPVYRFLLAQGYHANGSIEAALQEYRQVQDEDRTNAAAWINSGNIFFATGQYAQAAEEYRRAIQADPKSALAYYNLHLALQGALHLEEADAAFRQARSLDNDLITSILSAGGGEDAKDPVDAHYSGKDLLKVVQRRDGSVASGMRAGDWLHPLPLAGALGLIACAVLAWGADGWGLGRAQRCAKCGRPFCRRCQVGMRREEGYCTACRHYYLLRDPVPPRAREERERLAASHSRWQWIARRLVSLILPGSGQIQGGRSFFGAALLWATCVSVAMLMLSGKLLAAPQIALLHSPLLTRGAPVVVIALSWLIGNTAAFETAERR
ncbi:MAG TPA: tetratricopeptide repeat protein [Candidatus Polarisedimenticolia bacterium]|nr:tetratricopeptide repeat protein [Candidatus Polarisedimenticolia bacterium]